MQARGLQGFVFVDQLTEDGGVPVRGPAHVHAASYGRPPVDRKPGRPDGQRGRSTARTNTKSTHPGQNFPGLLAIARTR